MIVVFSGPPCSGKSQLGQMLSERRGYLHLEMDAVRVRVLPESAHTRQDRQVAYRAMHLAAEAAARAGACVIVNACYSHASDRRDIEQAAQRAGVPLYLVEFRVSAPVAVARWQSRRQAHPGADLTEARVRELVNRFPYFGGGQTVDGEQPAEEVFKAIEDYLDHGVPLRPGTWPACGE